MSERIIYPAAPLTNVWLQSGFEIRDGSWGKTVRYADLAGLGAAILYAVVLKPGRLSGPEITYLRRKLDLSQAECARAIGGEEQTLSLWERARHAIPISTDALLRRICIEQLRPAFPSKARFPKAVVLVKLATPMHEGEYVGINESGVWTVSYVTAQPEQLIAKPFTVATFFASPKLPESFLAIEAYVSSCAIEQSFDVHQVINVDDPALLEIFSGETRLHMRRITIDEAPAKAKILTGPARGLIEETYDVNPVTGAYFKAVSVTP